MKKISALFAVLLVVAVVFAGCARQDESNKVPTIVGVKDVQCIVNSTVDFLDGVAALDKEDGDITPQLKIDVTPNVTVTDGYATFTELGEYTVNFQITDSNGRTAQKRAYVEVMDRETYRSFALPEGFSAESHGGATVETCGVVDGAFRLKASGGEIAEDVQLVRTFTLSADDFITRDYTFRYDIQSNVEGKVKVLANGDECAELAVVEGRNELLFTHKMPASDENTCDVTVALCLGNLGEMSLEIGDVTVDYPQDSTRTVERTSDFKFAGRVEPRIDPDGVANGLSGNAWSMSDRNAARLEITSPSSVADDIWRGGMFVNTGVEMKKGVTYTVSFKVERNPMPNCPQDEEPKYQVAIQRNQWGEKELAILTQPTGTQTSEIIADENGPLWIYVKSGTQANQITLSELSVEEHLLPNGTDTFAVSDFTCYNATEGHEFHSELGNVTYKIKDFSATDSDHVVTSPSFYVAGSGANYVITFKAWATAPIDMVVAAPVADGWDPTIMWSSLRLSKQETVYTFACNGNSADRLHKLVWQFGFANNQQYHDVTVHIYDIRICLRNAELDG